MDFRLKVFVVVARHLNFTKAAGELHISQPAISKHIQELESLYAVQLFERAAHRVSLTAAGEVFLKRAEDILESYRLLNLDMNLQSGRFSGVLRIGASTTISQYVIPEIVAKFVSRFPDIRLTMFSGNSQEVEGELEAHRIDLGLVESSSRHAGFRYSHIAQDELVLVTGAGNRAKQEVRIEDIDTLPLVVRESGSGTLEVIEKALQEKGVKVSQLNVLLELGSTEGIKSFLAASASAYAFISIAALTKELASEALRIVRIEGLTMRRQFAFVSLQGSQNDLSEKFMRFVDNIKL